MDQIREFALLNRGAFVAYLHVQYRAREGEKWRDWKNGLELKLGAERVADLQAAGIPSGGHVRLRVRVLLGKGKTAKEEFIFSSYGNGRATYSIHGTTLTNQLRYEGHTGGMNMTDKQLAVQCIQMLEKYVDEAKNLPNNNSKVAVLNGGDMTAWKELYYPRLVETGKIRDGAFFQNPLVNRNYGIGQDGQFTKYEYVQFLWSAYKFVLGDFHAGSTDLQYIKLWIQRLEPYAAAFENHGTETAAVHELNSKDMQMWQADAYERLSKSGVIMDGSFFGDTRKEPRLGIGNDGHFSGEELCHFLFRLYQAAYRLLR